MGEAHQSKLSWRVPDDLGTDRLRNRAQRFSAAVGAASEASRSEHRFVGPAPAGVMPAPDPPRLCSDEDPADVERVRHLLMSRVPVSERAGIAADLDVFCFHAARLPIHYAPGLDALLDFTCEGGTLRLYDVVAHSMPSLAAVVAAVGQPVERVEVYFAPDRLDADLTPQPHDLGTPHDPDTWIVRGPWTAAPFLWPRTARW